MAYAIDFTQRDIEQSTAFASASAHSTYNRRGESLKRH